MRNKLIAEKEDLRRQVAALTPTDFYKEVRKIWKEVNVFDIFMTKHVMIDIHNIWKVATTVKKLLLFSIGCYISYRTNSTCNEFGFRISLAEMETMYDVYLASRDFGK